MHNISGTLTKIEQQPISAGSMILVPNDRRGLMNKTEFNLKKDSWAKRQRVFRGVIRTPEKPFRSELILGLCSPTFFIKGTVPAGLIAHEQAA